MTARDPLPGSYAQPLLPQLRPTVQQVWGRKVVAERIMQDAKAPPIPLYPRYEGEPMLPKAEAQKLRARRAVARLVVARERYSRPEFFQALERVRCEVQYAVRLSREASAGAEVVGVAS